MLNFETFAMAKVSSSQVRTLEFYDFFLTRGFIFTRIAYG